MSPQPPAASSTARKILSVTTLALSVLATGCTTLPEALPGIDDVVSNARADATNDWNATPALQVRYLNLPVLRTHPLKLPEALANRSVSLTLPTGATVANLSTLLGAIDIPTIVASEQLANKRVGLGTYEGRLGDLLTALSAARGLVFTWHNGILDISAQTTMTAYIPQNKELMKTVVDDLLSLGGSHLMASLASGIVSCQIAGTKTDRVKRYLHQTIDNTSTIALQIAIITVGLNRKHKTGLDWSRLQISLGKSLQIGLGSSTVSGGLNGNDINSGDNGDGTSNGDDGDSGSGGLVSDANVGAQLAGGTLGFVTDTANFDMQAMFSLLSTYGKTQTTQNLVLRTLSGGKVKIRSGATVPYVSDVSINSGDSGTLLGGTETETVETGLTLTIEPRYNDRTGLVTMDVDLKLKSILGFIKLQAGDQIGALSRPKTQDQSLKTVARVRTGHTVVLGGLIYDHVSDNRNTLAGLEDLPIGHQNLRVKRNALFVVIRPTVITYEFSDEVAHGRS